METTAKPTLKEILAQRANPTKAAAQSEQDITKTITPIWALMAQAESLTKAAIEEAISPIKGGTDRKGIQRAIQTLLAITQHTAPREPWEVAAQAELTKTLREKIATRIISRMRRSFQHRGMEETESLVRSLTPFRIASKPEEISFCSREMVPPGPSRLGRASHTKLQAGDIPSEVEELVYTLIQFRLGAEKNMRRPLDEKEATLLKELTIALQNPRGKEAVLPDWLKEESTPSAAGTQEFLRIVSEVFTKLNPDEKSKEALEREKEIFGSQAEDIGTELESLQGLQKEEFTSIRALETQYNKLNMVSDLKGKRPENPSELMLCIFQALRKVSPTLGKAVTLNLTTALAKDERWVESFMEIGEEAIFEARGYRNHIVLTEPENGLFGAPAGPEEYLQEGKTLLDAIALIDQAENTIYTNPLAAALSHINRDDAIFCAQRVIAQEATPEDFEKRPTLKRVESTRKKAQEISDAIHKEINGRERNLALLPVALRENEARTRVDAALTRLISTISSPEVQASVQGLLEEERENLSRLQENRNPDEADTKARIHCEEKIATLEAMNDIAENAVALEEKDYETLYAVASGTTVPKTLREHALVTLCDNKSGAGIKVKTKETLDRLENIGEFKNLTAQVRSALGTLRRWKERETTPEKVNKVTLAQSICAVPPEIKRLMKGELKAALRSCLEASPWKDPFAANPKEIGACNTEYLLAKSALAKDPKTFAKIRDLHAETAEIIKGASGSGWVKGQKLAEALSEKESALKSKENQLLEAILASKNPEPALAYMATWYNVVGNQRTLRRDALLPKTQEIEPIPMVGARIQSRIDNLLEIGAYAKAVATKPEALAEAFIQHELHEKRGGEERWDIRMERMVAKTGAEMSRVSKELEDWRTKFNAIFEGLDDDDLTETESERRRSTKTVCQKKLGQKERELESLSLKMERLNELKETCKAINGASSPEELLQAMTSKDTSEVGVVSIGGALDAAFALAKTPGKLNLPKDPEAVSAYQVFEGAEVSALLETIKDVLEEARKILKAHRPELEEIETGNPQETARILKKAAFQTLKDVEVKLWESGKSIDMAEEEMENFIRENPEVVSNRKDWIETLKKTQADLVGATELAGTLPQRKKKGKEKKAEGKETEEPVS